MGRFGPAEQVRALRWSGYGFRTRIDDTRLQPEAGVAVTMSIQPCDSGAAPVANALVPPEAMTGNMPANC